MRRFGLIGFPLSHSFSARYFTEKFNTENITDVIYENLPIENIGNIEEILAKYPDLEGLNVTIPYKELIIPYLDELDKTAKEVEAVNTIKFIRNEGEKVILKGYNTDVYGFKAALEPFITCYHRRALILGTGGASKAVSFILRKLGIPSDLVSRNKTEYIYKTYDELTAEDIADFQLIINTTPLGMYPDMDQYPEIPYEGIHNGQILFDLIYNPEETQFLAKGRERGATTINGLEMLKLQAEKSWKIWNEIPIYGLDRD